MLLPGLKKLLFAFGRLPLLLVELGRSRHCAQRMWGRGSLVLSMNTS